jgi:hypothetical protein
MRLTAFLFSLCWAVVTASSQESPLSSVRNLADSLYGLNDLLVNGTQYLPSHPRAVGHPFFPDQAFSGGVVFVKGERFEGVRINYDAEGDRLLLDVSIPMPWIGYLALNDLLADSFSLDSRVFVHARTLQAMPGGAVYLEKLYEGRFVLLARHQKKFKAEFNQWKPYGEYITFPVRLLLLREGVFHDVSREKQWMGLFSSHRKEVKKFIRKHKINFRKATTEQLKQIAAYCNGL